MDNVLLCIIAGGVGSRLWPLSTSKVPKQILHLTNKKKSLLELTLLRHQFCENVLIMCNKNIKTKVRRIISKFSFKNVFIVTENQQIGTASCAIVASFIALKFAFQSVILAPIDHFISDDTRYYKDILHSLELLNYDNIVIFGIQPSFISMQYGYIKTCIKNHNKNYAYVNNFIEKPSKDIAIKIINQGALWNSGIYIFKPEYILNFAKMHLLPNFFSFQDYVYINHDRTKIKLQKKIYSLNLNSFDIEVSTKIAEMQIIKMIFANFDWSDIGSFEFLWQYSVKDKNLNVINNKKLVYAKNIKNSYIYSDIKISLYGFFKLIVIINNGNILIRNLDTF